MTKRTKKAKDIRVVDSKVRVSRTVKMSGEPAETTDIQNDVIEVHEFVTKPSTISVTASIKMMKNYNSIGMSVTVTRPCYMEEEAECYEAVQQSVYEKLQEAKVDMEDVLDTL